MQLSVIDVSEHQGNIDWNKVKNAGIAGAMIRSGYGVKNPNQIDKQFHNNLAGCKAVGMSYGFYHYSYAMNPAEVEREADFCLEIIAGSSPQYPVAFDMEESRQAALGKSVCADIVLAFCNKIKAAGYIPMLYTNLNWSRNYIDMAKIDAAGIDVWMAQYNTQCDYTGNYVMWQYTSKGVVDGITANTVDMNWCYKDYTNGTIPEPMPEPTPQEPQPHYDTYTVMAGDTLSGIAAKFGTTYQELAVINGIENPNIIHIGQILKLTGNAVSNRTYAVKSGDTLWGIAQAQLGDGSRFREIIAFNGLMSDVIYPNQVLRLP